MVESAPLDVSAASRPVAARVLAANSCPLSADAGAASCAGIEAWLATADRTLRVGLLSHQAALLSTGETAAQAC